MGGVSDSEFVVELRQLASLAIGFDGDGWWRAGGGDGGGNSGSSSGTLSKEMRI